MNAKEYERVTRLNRQIEQIRALPVLYVPINTDKNSCILTNRKIEYLALASFGLNNKEIAKLLIVTESTVKQTLGNVYQKLHALDRANAVSIAWVHNILNTFVITNVIKRYENRIQEMIKNYNVLYIERNNID